MNVFEIFNNKPLARTNLKKYSPVIETIGPDRNDPYEQGWRARSGYDFNPYAKDTAEYQKWEDGQAERQAQLNHYDEGVAEAFQDDGKMDWDAWKQKAKQHGAVKFVDTDNKTIAYDKNSKQVSSITWSSKKKGVAEGSVSGYKEIEFVCVNPKFPEATDPKLQKQMYLGLQKIPGVIPLLQNWSDMSEGQTSLTAIYKDRESRQQILALAKRLGVSIDLEQPVSHDYVDRAVRGEHEGQQGVAEGKKRSDRYHIVGKDGNPTSLASYADQASAVKDRDEKHPGAEVRQVGPRGKIKGVSEGIMDVVKQAFNDNAAAWPMGTSDEQFIKSWADDIRDRTGRDIPVEKLAKLYQDYTRRSPDVMQSHGTTNEEAGVTEAERNELDTPAVQAALKNMAARHNKEQWSKEQLAALGRQLAAQDKKSVKEDATELNVGDDVIITGNVKFNGTTGMIVAFGRDKSFVVVNLYNHGKHSFHSSDVSANEYADSDAEEADMYDRDPDARDWASRQGGMEEDQWHGDDNAWSDGKGQWSDGRGQWSESVDRDVTEYLSEMKSAGYDIK